MDSQSIKFERACGQCAGSRYQTALSPLQWLSVAWPSTYVSGHHQINFRFTDLELMNESQVAIGLQKW
jgi:hypothetical protein